MNLQPLFEAQKKLDEHIERSKGLEGTNLLPEKILALQVELGELANEWRGFKYWSENRFPQTKVFKTVDTDMKVKINPLLEEYVDGLHFILSIGNDLGITHEDICVEDDLTGEDTTETFNDLFNYVTTLNVYLDIKIPASITREDLKEAYHDIFECFVGLGESQLGFTWEQIKQAYFAKNKENHRRQENGY